MNYLTYEKATGRIVAEYTDVMHLCGEDEGVLETALPIPLGNSHYVYGNILLPIPPSTSVNHVFDWGTKHWSDPRTLQAIKDDKNLHINTLRLAANQTYFTFAGKQIASDALSRGDIDAMHGVILLTNEMPENWVGGWKATDNTYVSIPDVATWALFYKAMVAQGSANFAHSQALKAQLAVATTIAEVESIVW